MINGPAPQRGIGVVVPFDFALDRELWRWAPPEVTLHLTRTPHVDAPVSIELAEAVSDTGVVRAATGDLLTVRPDVVAYACTSGSFVDGLAGERRLVEAMLDAGAAEAVTTTGAMLAALTDLGVERVAVATPYVVDVTAKLYDLLAEAGFTAVSGAQLGLDAEIWQVPYDTTAQLVRDADSAAAEAVFVSCTNLPTYDLIAPLEAELGKPVLTANQVTMHAALAALASQSMPH